MVATVIPMEYCGVQCGCNQACPNLRFKNRLAEIEREFSEAASEFKYAEPRLRRAGWCNGGDLAEEVLLLSE